MTVTAAFVILILIGVPIGFVLTIAGIIYMLMLNDPMTLLIIVPQRIFAGISSLPLMAVPFFILAGEAMNRGGMTERLVTFATLLVGFIRGGLAHATIIANFILAGISGSAAADAAALGSVLIPAMEKQGYDRPFSAAINASASVLGPIVPPSIPMIVYAYVANTSVAAMFAAGYLPGTLIAAGLMGLSYHYSVKRGYGTHRIPWTLKNVGRITGQALPALVLPFIIIFGILGGVFTATEASAVAAGYAIVAGLLLRKLHVREIAELCWHSTVVSAITYIVLAGGSIFGWVLAHQQIPQKLASLMMRFAINKEVFLVMIFVFLMIVGCLMDLLAATVILVPILLPLSNFLGINPLHFGMVFCLTMILGLLTPPVGLVLFVVCGIADISLEGLFVAVLPFLLVEIVVVLGVLFIPEIVLIVPRLLGLM